MSLGQVHYSGPPRRGTTTGNHCGYCVLFDGDANVRVVSGHTSMDRVKAHCKFGHGMNWRMSTDTACPHFIMDSGLEPFAR